MRREVKIGIFAVLMIGALWAGIRFLKGFADSDPGREGGSRDGYFVRSFDR